MNFQNPEKMGAIRLPNARSQMIPPASSPAEYPSRRSPLHTRKLIISQTQTQPVRNSASAARVYRGRRGRKNS